VIDQFSDRVTSFRRIADAFFFAEFYDIVFQRAFQGIYHSAVVAPGTSVPNLVPLTLHRTHNSHFGLFVAGNTKMQYVFCFTHE
jgi:hypothetical protein